jgi:hypothetical protein
VCSVYGFVGEIDDSLDPDAWDYASWLDGKTPVGMQVRKGQALGLVGKDESEFAVYYGVNRGMKLRPEGEVEADGVPRCVFDAKSSDNTETGVWVQPTLLLPPYLRIPLHQDDGSYRISMNK